MDSILGAEGNGVLSIHAINQHLACFPENAEEMQRLFACLSLEVERTRASAELQRHYHEADLKKMQRMLAQALHERDQAQEKLVKLQQILAALEQQQDRSLTDQNMDQNLPLEYQENCNSIPRPRQLNCAVPISPGLESSELIMKVVKTEVEIDEEQQQLLRWRMQEEALAYLTAESMRTRPLPEKGNFLKSVLQAGPLLETFIWGDPAPSWINPPLPIQNLEIPPITLIASPPPLLVRNTHNLHHQRMTMIDSPGNSSYQCGRPSPLLYQSELRPATGGVICSSSSSCSSSSKLLCGPTVRYQKTNYLPKFAKIH